MPAADVFSFSSVLLRSCALVAPLRLCTCFGRGPPDETKYSLCQTASSASSFTESYLPLALTMLVLITEMSSSGVVLF